MIDLKKYQLKEMKFKNFQKKLQKLVVQLEEV